VILLAKQEHKSVPALAKELVLEALECREAHLPGMGFTGKSVGFLDLCQLRGI